MAIYGNAITLGGSAPAPTPPVEKDINFWDYDGTLVDSWSLSELSSKTALPSNPDRTSEGLTADGWNWTLADLKATNRQMNVGQMYHTTDGALHIFIELSDGRLSPTLGIAINGTATIDWGDGNTDNISGTSTSTMINTQHTYANSGAYLVKVTPESGTSLNILGDATIGCRLICKGTGTANENRQYQGTIKKVFTSANTALGAHAFNYAYGLTNIMIAKGSATFMKQYCLANAFSLRFVVLPDNVDSLGTSALYNGRALTKLVMSNTSIALDNSITYNCTTLSEGVFPTSVTSSPSNFFRGCSSLRKVEILSNLATLNSYTFENCANLSSLEFPSTLATINSFAMQNCYGLGFIKFHSTTPPSCQSATAWVNLPTDCKILVPYSADHGVLQSYKTANNYPDPTVYTYEEY